MPFALALFVINTRAAIVKAKMILMFFIRFLLIEAFICVDLVRSGDFLL
jgi:hypothetical protein